MNTLFNELKIPTLTLTILMAIFSIARANAQFLSDLDAVNHENALPFSDEELLMACGYQSDQPLLVELPVDDE